MRFTKMQGLGNDYVYLDCTRQTPADLPGLARRMSDRHFGVGSDGLICICPSERGDFCMRMFNADGSEGAMCGNGIRCLGKFVYDKGLTAKRELVIETRAGLRTLSLVVESGAVRCVTVDMGAPEIGPAITLSVKGMAYTGVPVSMGNPHFVVETEDVAGLDLPDIGPVFEHDAHFPDRTNTEFVRVLGRDSVEMRVWERGSGETLACGTGACASVAALCAAGRIGPAARVELLGGSLDVRWDSGTGHIFMTGPAVTVFEGDWPDDPA